jgi:hypothetical protein
MSQSKIQPQNLGDTPCAVTLTVDQWSFIQAGLKDLADRFQQELDADPTDPKELAVIIPQNRNLADEIERQYIAAI